MVERGEGWECMVSPEDFGCEEFKK